MGNYFPTAILVAVLLSSQGILMMQGGEIHELDNDSLSADSVQRNTNIVDLPSWEIGDRWIYDGYLDVGDFVTSSGVSTNVQYLTGTLDRSITDIYTMTVDNRSTLVYKAESQGTYEANNVNLDGNTGDLDIVMDTLEIIRVSDLAVVQQEATIDIDFGYRVWLWTIDIDVAELTITQTYSPPTEGYDFPLSVGDYWSTSYYQEIDYEGSSSFVTIPSDDQSSESRSWQVMSRGAPGTSYAGCQQSYNVTTFDSNGSADGFRWFCPAVRGDVSSSTDIIDGINSFHELQSYQAGRSKEISVEFEFPLSPLDLDTSAWANVTQNGQPVSGQEMEFRYGIDEDVRTITTSANGSAHVVFNTGHSTDDSAGGSEAGSHGVIAWIPSEEIVGVSTITIDPNVSTVDLVVLSEGVTVERTRDGATTTLATSTGFNAVPLDTLRFYVPVQNRGLLASPATTMNVVSPDGSTQIAQVPTLSSLGQSIIEINWTIRSAHPIGDITLSFQVDPDEAITDDGDRSNNNGVFTLFIGRLPTASLDMSSQSLTKSEVVLDGSASYDEDGGGISCVFFIGMGTEQLTISDQDDCIVEIEWPDDGVFETVLVVTDDENDVSTESRSIEILNRPPEVTIGSEYEWTYVLSPIQFDVDERSDIDTQNPEAPMDILWNSSYPCNEGQVGIYCTVTPESEGDYTIRVEAVDDDGDVGYSNKTIEVRNIAPTNPRAEVWKGGNRMIPDSRGVYLANEGDVLTFEGLADDSPNDLYTLLHIWSPDAENSPGLMINFEGRMSTIDHTYHTSGLHLATLQVVDDDGASTESLIIPIEISNIDPQISPLAPPLPAAEDSPVYIAVETIDTAGDQLTLRNCFDLDPTTDSDDSGQSSDDCDVESRILDLSWPDATTAPTMIVFHVTDDDGSMVMLEIPLDIRNVNPVPRASVSSFSTVEGDVVFFSANGTTDSLHDIENMLYNWDMDTSVDSDGDGNAANDIDIQGKWVEWSFTGSGSRTISMTAVDEGNGASTTLTVSVSAAPFELSEFVASYGLILLIIVILALVGAVMVLSNRRSSSVRSESQFDQTSSLKRVSMDDAFDDPEYDPFDLKSRKDGPKKKALETVEDSVLETDELEKSEDSQTPEDTSEEEDNDFSEEEELEIQDQDHLTDIGETEEDSQEITAPLEAVLSEEDIEALFEE
tara:strand:+ start:1782 stop:5318 length:3537 start_codon:yes stop_codon:yes gene_type:complete